MHIFPPVDTPTAGRIGAVEAIDLLRQADTPAAAGERAEPRGPLSFAQERLWFLHRLDPASCAFNELFALRLTGALDIARLRRSLRAIVARHAPLRTTYADDDGGSTQIVHAGSSIDAPLVDVSLLRAAACGPARDALLAPLLWQPFDLRRGPVFRAAILAHASDLHELIVVVHHIACDGASLGIFAADLLEAYALLGAGRVPPAPTAEVSYVELARAERDALTPELLAPALEHWRTKLADLPEPRLPSDFPAPPVPRLRGRWHELSLDGERLETWRSLARQSSTTLSNALLATFRVLLYRYSEQEDVAVGVAVAGRHHTTAAPLIGFFSDTLMLRLRLDREQTFAQLLREVTRVAFEAFAHPLPYQVLVQHLRPGRDTRQESICRMVWAYQGRAPDGRIPGLELALGDGLIHTGALYDLRCLVFDEGARVRVRLEYATDLFRHDTIARVMRSWEELLRVLPSAAHVPLSRVETLPLAERRQLEAWNATSVTWPSSAMTHELVFAQAVARPDAIAVVSDTEQITYGELARRTHQLARYLRGRGVTTDACVALCLDRSIALVIAMLGVLEAGGAYLPLEPDTPPARQRALVEDARAILAVTEGAAGDALDGVLPLVRLDEAASAIARGTTDPLGREVSGDQLAYVLYTSGSTGRPKAVAVRHAALTNHMWWIAEVCNVTAADTILQKSACNFDASVWEFYAPLMNGGRLALVGPGEHRDPERLAVRMREYAATVAQFVPSMLAEVAREPEFAACRALRVICAGGEGFPRELHAALAAHGSLTVVNLYGPTEVTIDSTSWQGVPPAECRILPLGNLMANVRGHVLDREGHLIPIGAPGELFIGGISLARGYLHSPALTAEKFVPDPFCGEPGARLYRTGDRVRWRGAGVLEFLGRLDQQVKLRGYRIETGEIEATLAQVPGVTQSAVIVREDAPGQQRLIAYVVMDPTCEPGSPPPRWRVTLQTWLPEYMIPAALVVLDRLPLTANGKLDRRALPAPHAAATPTTREARPREGLETLIAATWTEVLRRDAVDRDVSFFELGGHSLLATQVVTRLRHALGIDVPLRALFETPTVAGLSAWVEQARGDARPAPPPIVAAPRSPEGLPLSFAQQRLWFLDRLIPESAIYNVPHAVRLRGPVNEAALTVSLRAIVARHEALRMRIVHDAGIARQHVDPAATLAVPIVDLRALPETPRETLASALAEEEDTRPFSLDRAPLVRAHLLRLADDDRILLLTLPHIVSDGWSVGVLIREFGALYEACVSGKTAVLPPLPIQYADFAVWQREWLTGDVLDRQIGYWRAQLAGVEPLRLPLDRPRSATIETSRAGRLYFTWEASLKEQLTVFSRRAGVTPFMTLLTAFVAVLSRWSGQRDVTIGTDVANRHHLATEGLIGFFVNQLVLRLRLDDAPTWRVLLARAREASLGAYAHQDLPFEHLVDALSPARDLARAPLFQVKFVLQNLTPVRLPLAGGALEMLPEAPRPARFDLSLVLDDTAEDLRGKVEYAAMWDEATIARLVSHVRRALETMIADPAQPVDDVSLVSDADRARLLRLGGADVDRRSIAPDAPALPRAPVMTHAPDVPDVSDAPTIVELFAARALSTPDAIALRHDSGQVSYAMLARRSGRLAAALRARGAGPELRVAVCLERSPALIEAWLGVLRAGAAYVPLDPGYPSARLALMLEDSGAAIVLTELATRDRLPAFAAHEIDVASDAAVWQETQGSDPRPPGSIDPDTLAYVIYTSGSTGQPKGVAVTHRALPRRARAQGAALGLGSSAPMLQFASASFDAAVLEWIAALASGASLVLATRDDLMGDALPALIQREQIHAAILTPTVLSWLEPERTPTLCAVASAGEVCRGPWVVGWARDRRLRNQFGPTETTIWTTERIVEPGQQAPDIGRPIPGVRAYVVEGNGELADVGIAGELWIGGDGLARGYLGRPALTAERFVPDPFSADPGARIYRSGDRVRWKADGMLEYLGRLDQQVKLHGHRIELEEIERILAQQPSVRQVSVILDGDTPTSARLVAFVVPEEATGGDIADLEGEWRKALRAQLPGYMTPAVFVRMSALPLTPSGKVDRRALPAASDIAKRPGEITAPRDPVEQALRDIWEQALRRSPIGAHDNFFELGGDSILSIQIAARATEAGLACTVRDLFDAQTIAALAARIKERGVAPALVEAGNQEVASAADEAIPLTPIQRWFFSRPRDAWHHYNQALWFAVRDRVDGAALREAWRALGRHHEALRLRFTSRTDGAWRQQVDPHEDGASWVTAIDVSGITPARHTHDRAAWESRLLERLASEAQRSLNLDRGPLVRVLLVDRGGAGDDRLLIAVHHLAIDVVSWRILLEDLQRTYDAVRRGAPVAPPARTSTYRAWSGALTRNATTAVTRAERDYWRAQTAGVADRCPRDMHGVESMTTSTVGRADSAASRSLRAMPRDVTVALDADTTRALVEGVPRAFGRTMQEALLAALARTIGEWSGRDRIVIDLESQGRSADLAPDLDVSRTVGWFTNVFPLRLPVVDGLMSAQVDAVAERLAAVPRDGIGYGLLRYLTPSAAQVTAVDTDGRRDVEAGFATPVEILFNYLGQLDLVLDRGALLAPADDPVGSSDSGARELPHLIAINCAVRGGRLSASWTTDARIYHESTIARLADRFVSHLRALVAESRTAARPAARDRSDPPVFDGDIAAVLAELQGD